MTASTSQGDQGALVRLLGEALSGLDSTLKRALLFRVREDLSYGVGLEVHLALFRAEGIEYEVPPELRVPPEQRGGPS